MTPDPKDPLARALELSRRIDGSLQGESIQIRDRVFALTTDLRAAIRAMGEENARLGRQVAELSSGLRNERAKCWEFRAKLGGTRRQSADDCMAMAELIRRGEA